MDALHYHLLMILSLLFVVFMLCLVSEKFKISRPILLLIGGLAISLLPRVPHIAIDPELIFLIFLPPLLYEGAWNMPWQHLWKRKRTVSLLAVGLVIFTSTVVAFFCKSFVPGFTLAMGFVLGGIISPTDAVSAASVLREERVPRRVQTILEGESLLNDAAGLIVLRFALAAVLSGQFSLNKAVGEFLLVTLMGVAIGLAVAFIIYFIYRMLPNRPDIDTTLSLMSPYMLYVTAEYFNVSGVMAVVSGGLLLSTQSHRFLDSESRTQSHHVWGTISFLLNSFVFLLIGLQLPIVVDSLDRNDALDDAIYYGIAISLLTLVLRFAWVYPAIFLPRLLSKRIRHKEKNPGKRAAFLISWAGMRGIVSMAAALSLPLALSDGSAFPHRNMILFITFVVILFTLLVQGLGLPFVIRKLKLNEFEQAIPTQNQEIHLRIHLSNTVKRYIEETYPAVADNTRRLVDNLRTYYADNVVLLSNHLESGAEIPEQDRNYHEILINVIQIQRRELIYMQRLMKYDTDLLRKYHTLLDLEESKIKMQ